MVFYSKQCTYNPQMWEGRSLQHEKQGFVGEAKQTGLNKKEKTGYYCK